MTESFLDDFKNIFGWKRKFKDAYWYVRGLLWDKYNIIKLRGIGPTYCDPCEKFHMALFQIVDDYLTKEQHIKTYEERVEFLARRKADLDEDEEKKDPCLENTRAWYEAFKTMIENVQWYKTTYALFRENNDAYYKSIGIEIVERPKYKLVRCEDHNGYRQECSEKDKEEAYMKFLRITSEADENLQKELKERMKGLVDIFDALWS